MPKRQHAVIAVESLCASTYRLVVERQDFQFKAGQCVNIGRSGSGVNREYSTYSGEQERELSFLIREVENGLVSTDLRTVTAGDEIQIDGAYGDFCLHEANLRKSHILVATGTGIAPFHSFVRSFPQLDYTIVHGIRLREECYDRDDYGQDRYISCVSQEAGGDFQGRVTDYLLGQQIDAAAIYYLCGNRAMINEVYDILRDANVPGDNLFTETFF